jgi:UDP-N-acetylglucosamine diphosphorylase/glucosamine-1-phosphate N-acetyltransferase
MVVADTTKGPVWIGPDAVISAFTRLEGPCVIGAGTQILGAKIRAGTTLGPQCRIGGEVECSIVQGFTNKYHDGFLGHSYVGEWVNLAAGASTGDLRCDYRPISARMNGRIVSTGLTKVGSIIGDHARTGLGVLLNCGTVIGPFAGILPTGELAPREFPAFARYGPEGMSFPSDIEEVLATADVAMRRRGQSVTPELREVYLAIAKEMWGSEAESNLGLREPA